MRKITDLAFGAKPGSAALRAKRMCAWLAAILLLGGAPRGLMGQAQGLATGGGGVVPLAAPQGVVPQSIRFSGVAENRAGDRVEVEFRIYAMPEGGEPLWKERQQVSIGQDGKYGVLLGALTQGGLPAAVFGAGQARWVGVSIERGQEGARVPLISVPYAMKAADAQTLAGVPAAQFVTQSQLREAATRMAPPASVVVPETISGGGGTFGSLAYWTSPTNLGASVITQLGTPGQPKIGVNLGPYTNPGATLDVGGTVNARNGLTASTGSGNAVFGNATAISGFANGVDGQTSSANGNGVFGQSLSKTNGNGVFGVADGASGNGVLGVNNATSGFTPGVTGITNSPNSAGVNGFSNTATGGIGVNGNASTNGTAILGGNQSCGSGGCIYASGTALSLNTGTGGTLIYAAAGPTGTLKSSNPSMREFSVDANGNGYFNGNVQANGVNGQVPSTAQFSTAVNGFESAGTGQVFGVNGGTASTTNGASGVNGYENATSGVVYGVAGSSSSTTQNAAGVNGYEGATSGQVYGVNGNTSSTGPGAAAVNGWEGATTGQVWGVNGSTNSTTNFAAGVSGYEGATTGQVFGISGGTSSTTSGASGVAGNANATTGAVYGVTGYTPSTEGFGVFGSAGATSGNTTGVDGTVRSPNGIGAFGLSTSTTNGTGVQGQTESTSGGAAGIFVAHGGAGLVLSGLSGSSFTQVFSVDASGNGVFSGNLNVKGTLSKGGGSFKIDDPLDPEHKYLSHSFVESPDMMNVYNGNVTTDKRGYATVVLPEYFGALNRDFRYQLTVMGQFAQAIVAQKVAQNRFVIRTSKPGVEVSWQVTGIRQDAWANANRIPVEEEKPSAEQGRYLHPELFEGTDRKDRDQGTEGPRGQGSQQR